MPTPASRRRALLVAAALTLSGLGAACSAPPAEEGRTGSEGPTGQPQSAEEKDPLNTDDESGGERDARPSGEESEPDGENGGLGESGGSGD